MEKENKNVFVEFFRKYVYYLLFVACILVLATLITLSVIFSNSEINSEPVNSPTQITFTNPVLNGTIIKGYSNTELQYNQTLKQWEAHFGIDFTSSSGSNVVACYDGTIKEVTSNSLYGTVVSIDHGDGLVTVYKSLNNVNLTEGTTVKQGDILGQISTSASNELKDGEHVHFEVWKNGSIVDPSNYLDIGEK